MRNGAHRGCPRALQRKVLPRGHGLYFVRRRGHLSLSVGLHLPGYVESNRCSTLVWLCGNDGLHRRTTCRLHIPLEERRARLAQIGTVRAKENVTETVSQNAELVVGRL